MLRARERFGYAPYKLLVARSEALLNERGVAADKIDSDLTRSPFKGECIFDRVSDGGGRQHGDGGDGYTLVDNRHTVLFFYLIADADEVMCLLCDFVIDLGAGTLNILTAAVEQRDAHGYGSYIEILILNHVDGFEDVSGISHMEKSFLRRGTWSQKHPHA